MTRRLRPPTTHRARANASPPSRTSQHGASRFASNVELVALLETMNVLMLFSALAFFGKVGEFASAVSSGDGRLLTIGVTSALIKAGSSVLFQRAVQISPVSLTVPYLAFTPALLLVTSYFMLGEVPEASGVVGVIVMTAGAYGLNTAGARGEDATRDAGKNAPADLGAASETRAPILGRASEDPVSAVATTALGQGLSSRGSSAADLRELAADEAARREKQKKHTLARGGGRRAARDDEASGPVGPLAGKLVRRARPRGDASRGVFSGWMLPREPGSRLMLLVAVLWSFTSDLDKMGKQACDAFVVFVAAQRFCMFVPTFALAATRRGARNVARAFTENLPLLFALASLELYTMTAYLMALDHLYVSYAIAAKRSGILLSVVAGALFFDEAIAERLPHVLVILFGMTLVLLAGDDDHDGARAGR